MALYASADAQCIGVSGVDLDALLMQLAETDVHAWLAGPASELGLTSLEQILTVPNRTRDAVVQSACAVLASHRLVAEAEPAADDEFAELMKGITTSVRRLDGHELEYQADDRLWRCARCGEHEMAIRDRGTGQARACPSAT